MCSWTVAFRVVSDLLGPKSPQIAKHGKMRPPKIAQNVHYADTISNMENKSQYRSFNELKDYYDKFNLSSKIKKQNIDPFGNKTNILSAAIEYLFQTKDDNTKTHYSYFGHTKSKTLLNAISNSLKTKKRWNLAF